MTAYHEHPANHAQACTGRLEPVEDHPHWPAGWVGQCRTCGQRAQIYRRPEDTRFVSGRGREPGVAADCSQCGRSMVTTRSAARPGVHRLCHWCSPGGREARG